MCVHRMAMVLSLLVIIILLCSSALPVLGEEQCKYYYSEQPPHRLSCDPYAASELKMECTAHGPVGAEFEVSWFSSRSDTPPSSLLAVPADDAVLMRNEANTSIRFQIREDETRKTIRSRLQILLQRDPPVIGGIAFWCSVTQPPDAADGSSTVTLLPSMVFFLHAPETYQNLQSCGDTPQSFHGERCAATISAPQPATPLSMSTTQSVQHSTAIETTPLSSSAWQELPPSSQLPRPTASVHSNPPPLEEGSGSMHVIVIPILACVTGVIGTLCLTSCIYLQCYRRRKSRKTVRKKVIEATHHTYSTPNSLSSSYQWKGAHQRPRLALLPHSPSSSPTLPPSRRTRSLKLGDSQNISLWSDPYVEMAGGVQREASRSSWPTLTGNPSLSDTEEGRYYGSSYEVPLPSCIEPEYATIPSPTVSYLIPVPSDMGHRLHHNSHAHKPTRPCQHPTPLSPHSHDCEEIIHISANRAYLEAPVPSEQQTAAESPPLSPLPSKTPSSTTDHLEAQGTVLET